MFHSMSRNGDQGIKEVEHSLHCFIYDYLTPAGVGSGNTSQQDFDSPHLTGHKVYNLISLLLLLLLLGHPALGVGLV